MKFLIAEDNKQNVELLVSMLTDYGGYDIAEDGKQAFNLFMDAHNEGSPYDLIFLDIIMPEIEGDQVLVMIREWEKANLKGQTPVPIVMASAKSDADTIFESYDQGCQLFVMKPYLKSELDDLMKTMGFEL